MRLVEVVMLMGAHCVSPVEHSQMMTDAAKVQCAVVIEKDTDKGTLTVTPPEAAGDPQVAAAVARFDAAASSTRIVPARAPAGSPAVETRPAPVAKLAVPPPVAPSAALLAAAEPPAAASAEAAAPAAAVPVAEAVAPPPEKPAVKRPQKLASIAAPPPSRSATRAAATPKKAKPASAQKSTQCKGSAVAKWYTAADGHRRFRCVGGRSAGQPDQLY